MSSQANAPFVHNAWYQAAWSNEIGDTPFARTLLNEEIVLFRDAGVVSMHWRIAAATGRLRCD